MTTIPTSSTATFTVEAVLFDMDGTLVDSIGAVEAAWGKVAQDIGQDPAYVIAATHGKRAIDNLKQFKPHIKDHEMNDEVQAFEETILAFADEHANQKKRRASSSASSFISSNGLGLSPQTLSPATSAASSRRPSAASSRRPSSSDKFDFGFNRSLFGMTPMSRGLPMTTTASEEVAVEDDEFAYQELEDDMEAAWDLEEDVIDRSVQILPGVRSMINSLPEGRYAVATSGAKTYAYGAMSRVGIIPPPVTITADDSRLKAGKPAPDPFLLAAKCLGYDAKDCVVFEDSPSGIKAGVASGATVIALCTSHERSKIENCGAHYLVENMEQVTCVPQEDGRLKFTITGL